MAKQTRIGTTKTLVTAAIVGLLVVGSGVSSAGAAEVDLSASALAQFRSSLTSSSDIAKFDALTDAQEAGFAAYLLGETDPTSKLNAAKTRSVDFELRTSVATTKSVAATAGVAAAAATGTRTVSAWQSFLFAGITISKTTVSETYNYSGSNATSVASYSCVVNANYDPFSTVTSAKSGKYISSGKATAECLVSVKRGVPTPWGQISWSTASNIQYVTGNGAGAVASHGWR